MTEKQFSRKELSDVLAYQKRPTSLFGGGRFATWTSLEESNSAVWARTLCDKLDNAGNDVNEICAAFRYVSLKELIALDRVRFELSRIPIWFRCIRDWKLSPNEISKVVVYQVQLADGRTFKVGSAECPDHVFEQKPSKMDYRFREVVLSFYPVDLARELGFEGTQTWDTSDSIVDWVSEFARAESLRAAPRLEIVENDTDIIYKLKYKSIDAFDLPLVQSVLAQQDVTSTERIYNFIVSNAPAQTKDIMAQQFTSNRHVYRILKMLESDGKIEKIGHGKYIVLK